MSKASPQLVRIVTDQVIGGVAPTGHPSRLRTVVDETLAQYPLIFKCAEATCGPSGGRDIACDINLRTRVRPVDGAGVAAGTKPGWPD